MHVAEATTEHLLCCSVDGQVSGSMRNAPLSDMCQITPSLQALASK